MEIHVNVWMMRIYMNTPAGYTQSQITLPNFTPYQSHPLCPTLSIPAAVFTPFQSQLHTQLIIPTLVTPNQSHQLYSHPLNHTCWAHTQFITPAVFTRNQSWLLYSQPINHSRFCEYRILLNKHWDAYLILDLEQILQGGLFEGGGLIRGWGLNQGNAV